MLVQQEISCFDPFIISLHFSYFFIYFTISNNPYIKISSQKTNPLKNLAHIFINKYSILKNIFLKIISKNLKIYKHS